MNSKFNKKRILSFLTAFVMMINIFANTNAFAADNITTTVNDYGIFKIVNVDGKPIQVNSPQDIEKYKAEFEKKLEELKKNGYTVLNSKVTISEPTVILTNDKKDGTYMMNGQEWKESEVKYSSNPGAGPVSLIGLTNTTTSAKIYAYCIDLFTAVSPGHVYTNEYIENLQYAAFKNNEAKLRTIVANSIGNVDIKTIRAAVGDQEITEEHAVRATQLLIWKIVHGGEYVAKRTQFNAGGVNVEFIHLLKFKSPSGYDTYIPYSTRGEWVRNRAWHATKVYEVLEYLDKLPVVNQLTNLPEPKINLENLTISKVENDNLFKISYDYSYSGKNSSGTDVEVDKTYYENTQELKSNMYSEVEKINPNGSRHVDITISKTYLKSGKFNVKLSALQSLDITNALLSKTDNRNASQTLITTKSTRNNRTAVIEGTVEYNNSQKAYSVSLKKVDSAELENGNVTKGLSNAKFEVRDANNELVDTQITSSNGIVTFANLKVGAYTIKEVNVPSGYKQLVQDIKLTVEGNGVIRALVDGKLYSTADGSTLLLPIPNEKKYENPKKGELKTTVKVAGEKGTAEKPATITPQLAETVKTVTDTIRYTDLVPNERYTVTGTLYTVEDGIQKEEVATASKVFTADKTGSGEWELTFTVNGLKANTNYVVFEKAVSEKPQFDNNRDNKPETPQTVVHEDPKDKSQTVAVTPQTVSLKAQKQWQNADGTAIADKDALAYRVDIELYRNNDKIETKSIYGNGEAVFSDLAKADESGVAYTYTLKETNVSVLSHLESQVTKDDITVFTNRVATTFVPPAPEIDKPELHLGFLEFSKVDISTRAAVEGATIQFYKEGEATPFLTGTTNAEGKIVPETAQGETSRVQPNGSIVLEVGKYFFKETNAPEGYVLNDKEQPFEITNEGITKAEFENKKESGFARIIKKDGDTQENIGGAVFDIYKKGENGKPSGAVIQQVAVSAEGSQIELETGRYIAVEISAPAGYVLPDNMLDRYKDFTVDRNNTQDSPIEVVVFNKKPSVPVEPTTSPMLYLTKVDETGRPLAGATLSIFRQGETDPIITGVTNENGKLEVQTASGAQSFNILEDGRIKLENGEYVVRETNAPEGYVLDETERAFILSEQSMNATVTIVNQKEKPQPISITVRKSWTNVQDGKTAADYRATIQLLQNGSIIATKEVVGDMEIVFDNLAKLDANGNEYNYEVKEVESNEFKLVVNTREGDVVTLQNEIIVPPVPPTPIIPNEPNEPNEPPTPPTPPTIPSIPNTPDTPPVIPNEPNEPNEPPKEIEEDETPLAKPTQSDEPPTVIEEDVPTSVPSTTPEITEIEEDVPLGLPKTGSADTTALGLMLLALGMMVARKRK